MAPQTSEVRTQDGASALTHLPRVMRFSIRFQHVLYGCHNLGAHLRNTPFLLLPRLESVLLSCLRMPSWEIEGADPSSTTFPANRRSGQWSCPSGAGLQARAMRWASLTPGPSYEPDFFHYGSVGGVIPALPVPATRAMERVLQCVASDGALSSVSVTTRSTSASPIWRGAPGRGSSSRPSTERSRKRFRHLLTIYWVTPSSIATIVFVLPSAQVSTRRARCANSWAVVRLRLHLSTVSCSSPVSVSGGIGRTISTRQPPY